MKPAEADLLLRSGRDPEDKKQMVMFEEYFAPQKRQIHGAWEDVAAREKRSRTVGTAETAPRRQSPMKM